MKFVQRSMGNAADASARRDHMALDAIILTVALALALVALYFLIGVVVDAVVARIPPEAEARIFSSITPSGFSAEQPEELARWQALLDRLAAQPGVPPLPYKLSIDDDFEEPNAFAFPGGYIAITRGLLDALGDDETAMAFVLGHELGHYHQRDHLRGLGRQIGLAICFSLIAGAPGGDIVASMTSTVATRHYSRGQEEGADAFGARLVQQLYADAADAAERVHQLLDSLTHMPAWAYMLATHPDPARRLDVIREALNFSSMPPELPIPHTTSPPDTSVPPNTTDPSAPSGRT